MECSICYEDISENEIYKKWKCTHVFHEHCANEWNNGCPNCRCMTIRHNENITGKNPSNILNISLMANINPLVGDKKMMYMNKWNDRECITQNHNFICSNGFGVVLICEHCNTVQTFNRIH
jgi:hypothetical protein